MEIELTCPQEFEIRAPRLFLILGLGLLIIVVTIMAVAGVNIYLGNLSAELGFVVFWSQTLFLFMSILSLCVYRKDFFRYNNGEFSCKRVPRKIKTWRIDDVSCVIANTTRGGINIQFLNKDNKRIITLTDDECCIWKDGRLRKVLYVYNIPLKGNAIEY